MEKYWTNDKGPGPIFYMGSKKNDDQWFGPVKDSLNLPQSHLSMTGPNLALDYDNFRAQCWRPSGLMSRAKSRKCLLINLDFWVGPLHCLWQFWLTRDSFVPKGPCEVWRLTFLRVFDVLVILFRFVPANHIHNKITMVPWVEIHVLFGFGLALTISMKHEL